MEKKKNVPIFISGAILLTLFFFFYSNSYALSFCTDEYFATNNECYVAFGSGPQDDWFSTTDPSDPNSWLDVDEVYPNSVTQPTDIEPNTSANLMWHWDSTEAPTGRNGSELTFYKFDLGPLLSGHNYSGGEVIILVDDYFELYLNGESVGTGLLDDILNSTKNAELSNLGMLNAERTAFLFELSSCQSSGSDAGCLSNDSSNEFLIVANDGHERVVENNVIVSGPEDRLYEYVFFDAKVFFPIPEPSTFFLFLPSLIFFPFFRKNRAKC